MQDVSAHGRTGGFGKIMEFVSDIFEKLKRQVEKDCRFRIVVSRLEIGGY